jgi:hypothetical protein
LRRGKEKFLPLAVRKNVDALYNHGVPLDRSVLGERQPHALPPSFEIAGKDLVQEPHRQRVKLKRVDTVARDG